MTAPWPQTTRLAALDFESSGTDPHEAFIVTACLALVGGGRDSDPPIEWLLSPGDRNIPAEATAIHKVHTAYAREFGVDHRKGVDDISEAIAGALLAGCVLVGHNVGGYDLTLIEAECRREGVPTVSERLGGPIRPVLDTMVLSRHVDPYRKRPSKEHGAHTLRTTAVAFELPWDDKAAHGSTYDALMSARAAWKILSIANRPHRDRPAWVKAKRTQRFDDLAGLDPQQLHDAQVRWAAEQTADRESYFADLAKDKGEPFEPWHPSERQWPVKGVSL